MAARTREVGEAVAAGESIRALEERFNVKKRTVLSHLMKYVQAGKRLPPKPLWDASELSGDDQIVVLALFGELGTDYLKPVFERMGGRINYDELELMRLIYFMDVEEK